MLFGAWTHGITGSRLVGGSDPPKEEEFFWGEGGIMQACPDLL